MKEIQSRQENLRIQFNTMITRARANPNTTGKHVTNSSATHLHLRDETLQQSRRPLLLWPQLFSDAHLHETLLSDYLPRNHAPISQLLGTKYNWQKHITSAEPLT